MLSPDLSDGERAVIAKALAPDPMERYRTAQELAEEIDALA